MNLNEQQRYENLTPHLKFKCGVNSFPTNTVYVCIKNNIYTSYYCVFN